MDWWLITRVALYAHSRRRAFAAVRTWTALEAGRRTVLLLRNGGGAVFQVAGFVRGSAAGEAHHRVEVQIPWDAALTLAAWAGKAVRENGKTVLHSYVARVEGIDPPPLRLVYRGYVPLRGAFIYKVLDAPPGSYLLEISFGGVPVLFPTKYYKYPRQGRKAGGDAGAFAVPLDVLRTFHAWGLHELGADFDYVHVKVWRLDASAHGLAETPLWPLTGT